MRLVVISGMLTTPFSLRVTQVNAARGTEAAMVGMRFMPADTGVDDGGAGFF